MNSGSFKNYVTYKLFIYKWDIFDMYKRDLALNNLLGLICHKIQPTIKMHWKCFFYYINVLANNYSNKDIQKIIFYFKHACLKKNIIFCISLLEFRVFLLLDWFPNQDKRIQSAYYLSIAGERIIGFIPFPKVLVVCDMQSALSRNWTRLAMSVSHGDNHNTTGTSIYKIYFAIFIKKKVLSISDR